MNTFLIAITAFLMEIGLEKAPENFAYTVLKISGTLIVAIVGAFMVKFFRLANWVIFIPIGIAAAVFLWLTTLKLEEWQSIAVEAVKVLFGIES